LPDRTQQQRRGGKQPQQRKRRIAPVDVSEMFDVHLRFGLEDQFVRVPKLQWKQLVDRWIIDGEDVVLRSVYTKHEENVVLRGTYHAIFSVRPAEEEKHIPVYEVIVCSDVRNRRLAEQGL